MKVLIIFLGFPFLLIASWADTGELYQWVDETGKICIVDDISRVPETRRDQIKVYKVPTRPEKSSRTQKGEVSEPAQQVSERVEQPDSSARAAEERAARMEMLRQKKAELEETITIARAQARRFGRIRATSYMKKADEAYEELQAVQNELDAIQRETP